MLQQQEWVTGVLLYMFTNENLRQYTVLKAMGASTQQLLAMIFVQTGLCAGRALITAHTTHHAARGVTFDVDYPPVNTNRVPTAEWITLSPSSARARS